MTQPDQNRLLDVDAAAAYLGGISTKEVRRLHWRGELKAVRIGRRVLFTVADLSHFVDSLKRPEATV
jgi:excisionase family DNA binding protein